MMIHSRTTCVNLNGDLDVVWLDFGGDFLINWLQSIVIALDGFLIKRQPRPGS